MENEKILVIGASGLIGGYLYDYLSGRENVIGTCNLNKKEELVHFDITNLSYDSLDLSNVKYMVICSGIAKMDRCLENPEYSRLVNVEGVQRLVKHAHERGVIPLYVSSASVFDGETGNYKEDERKNPVNFYGSQKAEVEDFMISELNKYLIVRPGKVFGVNRGEVGLFTEWLEKYKKRENIFCADDERVSPICSEDLARGIYELMRKNSRRIFHLNPQENYSRFELANKFFKYFGINDAKIIKCTLEDLKFPQKRMKNSFLDSLKFISETGFKFTRLEDCFERAYKNAK